MRTADLVAGPQTDALVALACGFVKVDHRRFDFDDEDWHWEGDTFLCRVNHYSPSTTRAQWAELIEVFYIDLDNDQEGVIEAIAWADIMSEGSAKATADTYRLAICKAVIATKWGDEIPDEIWEKVK